jgi:endoglucanase
VQKVGGVDMRTVAGMELTFHGKEDIYGVVCTVPPHLSEGESRVSKDGTCVADTGLAKDEAEKIIAVGDKVSFKNSFEKMGENRVTATYIDDRGGIAVLLKALEYTNTNNKITLVCPAQEETGGTGATCASFNSDADLSLSVDVSFAHTPDSNPKECGKMNGGPMIGYSPILSREYSELLVKTAEENNIPYQKEIMNGKTGTNADHITISKGGIPSALVSLPQKYMHTPVETVDIRDIENCAKLIARFLERV